MTQVNRLDQVGRAVNRIQPGTGDSRSTERIRKRCAAASVLLEPEDRRSGASEAAAAGGDRAGRTEGIARRLRTTLLDPAARAVLIGVFAPFA